MTTWEIALMLTDPSEALLVDIRDSVLLFLPHYTDAVVMLQHLIDLFYGFDRATGHKPSKELPEVTKKLSIDPKGPFWIRCDSYN